MRVVYRVLGFKRLFTLSLKRLIRNRLLLVFLLSVTSLSYAGAPVWTFTPLTVTSISVPGNNTATIQYQVTNQSSKSHSLVMTPITGITQTATGLGICSNPFTLPTKGSSCTLSLQVNGNQLTHSITDGPVVCEQSTTLQCYKPSPSNVLNINVGLNEYTIGGTVSGLSSSVVLQNNGTDNETVSSDGGFTFSMAIAEGNAYAVTVLTQPADQTCTVMDGSGTVQGSNITNVAVNCVTNPTTLTSIDGDSRGLSVDDTTLNAALTGNPRLFTIRNSGSTTAENIACPTSGSSSISSITCSSSCNPLFAGQDCEITITPSGTASAAPGVTNPTPVTLNVSGSNTNTLALTVNVLTYGSVYQGGYVYAVDDTTPDTGSIGGKVAALTDQSSGIMWGSDGIGGPSYIAIYGISEISTIATPDPNPGEAPQPVTGQMACDGNKDGSCDSNNIYVYYETTAINAPINTSLYATGLCKATINGYNNWYLPAICEMGFDLNGNGSGCGTQSAPTLQNMQSNLVSNSDIGGLSGGNYWSSTEFSINPAGLAWFQVFTIGGGDQLAGTKEALYRVRCSRLLTP